MKSFVFFISIVEMCLFIFTLCFASVAYAKSKSRFHLKLLLLITIFIIENIVIYVYSYLFSVYSFTSDIIILIFLIINSCYTVLVRMISKNISKDPIANYEIVLYFLYVALQVILLILNESKWFYNTTSIVFLYITLRAIIVSNKKHIATNSTNILFLSSFVLGLIVILEDIFAGSFASLYGTMHNAYIMSISLNVLSTVHCIFIIYYCRKYFASAIIQDKASLETGEIDLKQIIEKFNLTNREQDVLKLLIEGKSNKEIASDLFISIGTVKTHTHNIFTKCEVTSKKELLQCLHK